MNFYEELDLGRTASADQIHQAYKGLARLMHPDRCPDDQLRALAQLQMKRLNQILAVLADPEARRQYDATLDAPCGTLARSPVPVRRGPDPAAWVWLASAAIVIVVIACFLASNTKRPVLPHERRDTAQRGMSAAPLPRPVVPAVSRQFPESPGAQPELDPPALHATLEPPAPAAQEAELALFDLPPAEHTKPARPEPAPAADAGDRPPRVPLPQPPARGLAGNWFYVSAAPTPPSAGVYPPEYIELRVVENSGAIHGRYRARYKVTDQAISPEVSFEFQGSSESSARLPWAGPGGARGEVALKLVSDTAIEVNWKAYRLSSQVGLAAGTATLIREQLR
jgi:hypothetical protein